MRSTMHKPLAQIAAAGLLISLAAGAHAQSPAPAPPRHPAIPQAPVDVISKSTSTWTFSHSENGKTVKVTGADGKIAAEIDGQAVPEDRIIREGDHVIVKDQDGSIVFNQSVPTDGDTVSMTTRGFAPRALRPLNGLAGIGAAAGRSPFGAATIAPVDPPKVMVGAYLTDPDQSLRGHLGLEENTTTLIAAVYEGLPAAAAGIEPYDIIVSVEGKTPANPDAIREVLRAKNEGDSVNFEILHKGQKKAVTLTVSKYDRKKIESAKRNAIAAMDTEDVFDTTVPGTANIWLNSPGAPKAFVARVDPNGGKGTGQSTVIWQEDESGAELDARIKILTEQAMKQAERAQSLGTNQAELHERMNKLMEERMRKMEEMLQKIMERQGNAPAPAEKPAGSSSSKSNSRLRGTT